MKNGVWWVFAAGESVCQGTLCAKHHTLAVGGGVLSGVRRAHTLHAAVRRMACGGSVLRASLHTVGVRSRYAHAPDTGSRRRCRLRGEEGTPPHDGV